MKGLAMPIDNALAGVAVSALASALLWYQKFLGRPADHRPMPEVAEWTFPAGGGLQVFEDRERAGSSSVTLSIADLDGQLGELRRNGIVVDHQTHSPQVNTATLHDPDGNQIVLAQALVADIAH
jgi:predicted enzyme related to lactoylglutathione lyase